MCIGIPMQVIEPGTLQARCRQADGAEFAIDMRLVGAVPEGMWVLTFLGAARDVLTDEAARQVNDALSAMELAMRGESVDHLFADLLEHEPQLPDFAKEQT